MSVEQGEGLRFEKAAKGRELRVPAFISADGTDDSFIPTVGASPAQPALAAGYRLDQALGLLKDAMVLMALVARGGGKSGKAEANNPIGD
jgi:hypothetical protein